MHRQIKAVFLAILFSAGSALVVTNVDCGFFQIGPCGSMVGMPIPYSEYNLDWTFSLQNNQFIITNQKAADYFSIGNGPFFPFVKGYPYHLTDFSPLLFIINCISWLIISEFILYFVFKYRTLQKNQNLSFESVRKDKRLFILSIIVSILILRFFYFNILPSIVVNSKYGQDYSARMGQKEVCIKFDGVTSNGKLPCKNDIFDGEYTMHFYKQNVIMEKGVYKEGVLLEKIIYNHDGTIKQTTNCHLKQDFFSQKFPLAEASSICQ